MMSSFSVRDIQDDTGETFELEIIPEAKEQKRRTSLDYIVEGKKVRSINELNNIVKDSGDRGKVYSRKREPAKGNHQLQAVVSDRHQNGFNVYHRGFGRSNSSHKQQYERLNSHNSSWGTMSTYSTVKNTRSSETVTKVNPPGLRTSSGRLSNRSSASSMGQVGASHGSFVKQCRADELGLCSLCNRRFPNLSKVGFDLLMCSGCRRRLKTVNPAFSPSTDYQTPAVKLPGNAATHPNGKREKDIIGRTPDTAMEIDSSDNDEEATTNDTRSAMESCEQECQSSLQSTANRMESLKIAYPSRTDPEAVEILASDIQRLNPLEFLNDTIIDFYIKYIQREFLSLEGGRRFHFFNSFFYKKLSGVIDKKKKKIVDYSKLRKWTRGINIFEKDYLFIPVHDKLHWSLAIVCFPNHGPGSVSGCERCILHLDSMTCGHDSVTVFRLLRSYLVAERAELKGDININTIAARKVPVPLQENDSDCGLFLLHYIRKFVESAPKTMKMSDVNKLEDLGLFGRQWFFPIEASSLRTSIQEQLQILFARKDESLGVSSDANLQTSEVGIPRNLEAEFWSLSVVETPQIPLVKQSFNHHISSMCGIDITTIYDLLSRLTTVPISHEITKPLGNLCVHVKDGLAFAGAIASNNLESVSYL